MSEKIVTYTLEQGDGSCKLHGTDIKSIIDTLETELHEADVNSLEDEDDYIEFTIRIEKKFTQEEINNLPDWDGF